MGGNDGLLGSILNPVTDLLFGRPEQPEMPDIPDPVTPAAPAPGRKQDTGAVVKTGADAAQDVKNQRVSGTSSGSSRSGTSSSLGTLGRRSVGL